MGGALSVACADQWDVQGTLVLLYVCIFVYLLYSCLCVSAWLLVLL